MLNVCRTSSSRSGLPSQATHERMVDSVGTRVCTTVEGADRSSCPDTATGLTPDSTAQHADWTSR